MPEVSNPPKTFSYRLTTLAWECVHFIVRAFQVVLVGLADDGKYYEVAVDEDGAVKVQGGTAVWQTLVTDSIGISPSQTGDIPFNDLRTGGILLAAGAGNPVYITIGDGAFLQIDGLRLSVGQRYHFPTKDRIRIFNPGPNNMTVYRTEFGDY